MIIVGCDYHPGFQQIAFVDTETGELQERRLGHREEAERFYRELAARGVAVSGYASRRRIGKFYFPSGLRCLDTTKTSTPVIEHSSWDAS